MANGDELAAYRRGHAPRGNMGFGHHVRTYVLDPYQQVKDIRTEIVRTDAQAVLDGDLDVFIEAELVRRATAPPPNPNAANMD